jgi:VWFA-related protein
MPFPRALALVAAIALAQAPPPPPQQPAAQPPQQPPRFRGGANLVRVDVYATKDGVPVQDLAAADLEISEDKAPQKIESFERIAVNPAGRESAIVEPSSPSQALQLVADARRRAFVIFLDTHHVPYEGSHGIKEPLIDFMQRALGEEDLIALMTPDMSPDQLAFGYKTKVIEADLRKTGFWGRRDSLKLDGTEQMYSECFPLLPGEQGPVSALAKALIQRRRERATLDALHDLVRYMGTVREGRTAVVTVTDGWLLYRPDPALQTPRRGANGRNADPLPGSPDRTPCDRDRMDLAQTDDEQYFRLIYGEANRANVSFYTIDPRGLTAVELGFVNSIGGENTTPAMLRARQDSLRTLAETTDGLAMLNSNDLRKQLRRIADDLTSYYLLGYVSTNGKLDGKFRSITVRSKRPGVEIRARRGYNAPTAEEVARVRAAADIVVPEAQAALSRALGTIESDARAVGRTTRRAAGDPVVLHRGPSTGNQIQPAAGRVFPRSERIRLEFEADAGVPVWTGAVLDRNGTKTVVPVATSERTDATTGQRWLVADITLAPLGLGDYVVELSIVKGSETQKSLVAFRVTQ